MHKSLCLFLALLLGLVLVACGSEADYAETQPQISMIWLHQTDAEGCPISQKESANSGYPENQLPSDLNGGALNFILYSQQGQKLVETQVTIKNECTEDEQYNCMLPNSQSFQLFNVPTQQNMHLEVQAFNSLNQMVWIGHNYNVDVTEQAEANPDAVQTDIFMRRVARFTYAFDCMETERMLHSATLLRDGTSVLIAGGLSIIRSNACSPREFDEVVPCDLGVATKQVVLFDTTTGTYTNMAQLDRKRAGHEAILLADGRVLIMGGTEQVWFLHGNNGRGYLEADLPLVHKTAVLYNPDGRGHVDAVINMNVQRAFFSVTPIDTDPPFATVFLAAGGWGDGGRLSSMEILSFDPSQGQRLPEFRILNNIRLMAPRSGHTATRIASGHVFFYGGAEPGAEPAEIFISETSGMQTPDQFENWVTWANTYHHAATSIDGGQKVLVTGGIRKTSSGDTETFTDPIGQGTLIDFSTSTSTIVEMKQARAFHKMATMPDNRVVVVGGVNDFKMRVGVPQLELFDGASFDFLLDLTGNIVSLGVPRMSPTLTTLRDNSLVIVGGAQPEPVADFPTAKTILRSTEIYLPSPTEFPSASATE